jgi:O-antigen/teichoic acid export membrane protein
MSFFRITFHYFTFLILIITGFIYFFIDFFLLVVYGYSFLDYSILLKLMIITIIFGVQETLFFSLLRSGDKIKYIIPVSLILVLIRLSSFLLGIIFFDILGALIALVIANIIDFIIIAVLNYKIFNIKLNLMKTFLQYIIFFVALGITLLLEYLFLKQINYLILSSLNLLIFRRIEFLSLFTFLLIYFLLNYIFKIFSRADIENLEKFFDKEGFFHRLIRKVLKFLKRIIRK